jgi:Ca-activated chloride channel family protein
MSTHSLAKFYTVIVGLVVFALVLSGCGAAAPAATQAPVQATSNPTAREVVVTKEVQAPQPAAPAAMPTAAPAASMAGAPATSQGAAAPAATQAPLQPPADAKVPCCPPTPLPFPTYPPAPERPVSAKPFMDTREDHLSTFGMDVDTASYTQMRDYLRNSQLPPIDLVRVEEFINYFKQEYPDPTDGAFSINLEGARSPFSPEGTYLLKVGLQGKHLADWQRKDALLTFVMDVSGSMQEDDKINMVKHGLTTLVDQLGPNDRVAIVAFTDTAWVALEPTSVENRSRILDAINSLYPMNSTNTEAGLRLGYELAQRYYRDGMNNRVILATDGMANVGNTDPNVLAQYAQDYYGRNIFLSTVGVGRGNYNDQLLVTLADKGNGVYSFLDSQQAAERIFAQDLNGTLETIAKDAKIQVDFNPNTVRAYRLIGYEKRAIADQDFRNNSVDAGEVGAGHSVTALYEVSLNPESNDDAAIVRVRYEDPDTHAVTEQSKAIKGRDFQSDFNRMSPRFQLTASVAQFAEILRGNEWAKNAKMRDVLNVMRNVQSQLPYDQDVNEFTYLVEQAMHFTD